MALANDDFAMTKEALDEGVLFTVSGAVTSNSAPDFREALLSSATENNVLIDLSKVTMLTSTGVGALFELTDAMSKNKFEVVLINPSDRVNQVIDLTGFRDLFNFATDQQDARDYLAD